MSEQNELERWREVVRQIRGGGTKEVFDADGVFRYADTTFDLSEDDAALLILAQLEGKQS